MADGQQLLDLILARNLMSVLETPCFLVDHDGVMVFFNEAAGKLIGKRFEETGRLTHAQWNASGLESYVFIPADLGGPPLSEATREGRPSHGRFHICTDQERIVEVETSAVPLVSRGDFRGALVLFWPAEPATESFGGTSPEGTRG